MGRWAVAVFSCVFLAIVAPAQTLTTIASFNGTNGAAPHGGVIQGTDGNFYGTTFSGGSSFGTVFKLTSQGSLSALYNFCSLANCADGSLPNAGLVQGTDGAFYGTTASLTTVFKITSDGKLTTLHTSSGPPTDGTGYGPLIQASDGNFYGTAALGGSSGASGKGGTVFKVSSGGTFATIYNFCSQTNCSDGSIPPSGVVEASDGNFYGVTAQGGANNVGSVFRVTSAGQLTTLYSFAGNGTFNPRSPLIQASDGNLYGTTASGGPHNQGSVFRITLQGVLTTLHNFSYVDGAVPYGGLVEANDGNLYGTTTTGGTGSGTIFRMSLDGTLTTLYQFQGTSDGATPYGALIQANDGTLYGTTSASGANSMGTVFKLDVGLPGSSVTVSLLGGGTVNSADGFIRCGAACLHTYLLGTAVHLVALPNVGFTLAGMAGCDTLQGNHCSLTVNGVRTVAATFNAANVTLQSLAFKPSTVGPARTSVGTVSLSAPAPMGGVTVGLTSGMPSLASVPKSIYMAGGASTANFVARTYRPHSKTNVKVTATAGSSSTMGVLTVDPKQR